MKRERIWVVDDDPDQRVLLKQFFLGKPFAVQLFSNGKLALEAFQKAFQKEGKQKMPSLILLDIMMPEMDGVTCLKQIRKLTKKEFVPILMLTAKADSDSKIQALKEGADDFITKPFDMEELEARVEVMLRIKRSEDKIKKYSEKLKRANQLKEEMLAICSHDLQTPLSTIIMMTDTIMESHYGKLNKKQKIAEEKVQNAANRAQLLVRDILDLGKLEQTRAKLQKVGFFIDFLVRECIESLGVQAEKRHIKLGFERKMNGAVQAYGDPRWIEHVLQNLLSNAIKFNKEGGRVQVVVKRHKFKNKGDGAKQILVEVRDTGRGIPKKEMSHLFDKYTQLKKRDALKGTGLGLAICRKIVNRHHGNIWVKSKLGKGSTFCFTLPVK